MPLRKNDHSETFEKEIPIPRRYLHQSYNHKMTDTGTPVHHALILWSVLIHQMHEYEELRRGKRSGAT